MEIIKKKNNLVVYQSVDELKLDFNKLYVRSIMNYFGEDENNKQKTLRFMTSVVDAVRRTPKLLQCNKTSLVNAFINIAELGFMPSSVSGEAYVIPYGDEAQFQLGYQGIITLLYRAGTKSIRSEIVRKNDKISIINGVINHEVNPFISNDKRGEAIGAYAIAVVNGEEVSKFISAEDLINHGKRFSKTFKTDFTPWKAVNDPELWMWKKTTIKQLSKLLPKNETLNRAIELDNRDSDLSQPRGILVDDSGLQMKNFISATEVKENNKKIIGESNEKNKGDKNNPKEEGEELTQEDLATIELDSEGNEKGTITPTQS